MTTATAAKVQTRENDVVEAWIRKHRSKRHRGKRGPEIQRAAKPPVLQGVDFYPSKSLQRASWVGTVTIEDFRNIAKRVVPYGVHDEIAYALELNHQHKGAICELLRERRPITRMHIYSIIVSYLRHEHSEYDNMPVRGGRVRKQFNDHETAKSIMGERIKW